MIGGSKVNLATNAILSKLIADTLATKYSWKKRKKGFYGTIDIKVDYK